LAGKSKGKGSKAAKEAKREIVAAGIVAGKSATEIAQAADCNPRHVQRVAAEPETQFLVTELLRPHRQELADLATDVIRAVQGGLKAAVNDIEVGTDGKKRLIDHSVRLRAVQRYRDLVNLAQGAEPPPATDRSLVTWEEYVVLYNRRTERPA
jgi:hypothetical protein